MEGDIKVSGVRNLLYIVGLRMSGICTASNFRNQTNKQQQQQKKLVMWCRTEQQTMAVETNPACCLFL